MWFTGTGMGAIFRYSSIDTIWRAIDILNQNIPIINFMACAIGKAYGIDVSDIPDKQSPEVIKLPLIVFDQIYDLFKQDKVSAVEQSEIAMSPPKYKPATQMKTNYKYGNKLI